MWFLPKDYVGVHTRVENFHKDHDNDMSIDTHFELQWEVAIFKAEVKTKKWTFTWSSFWKLWKEKAFEKLETVAVGRALAFAWYEVKNWIASREEVENFEKISQKVNKKELIEYIEEIREEKDINHIETLYKEAIFWKLSEKQKNWLIEECKKAKEKLQQEG